MLDTVGQCPRLCRKKLGPGDCSFLVPSQIARVVEAQCKEGAEIVLDSGSSSEEEVEELKVIGEPSSTAPSSDPSAGPAT